MKNIIHIFGPFSVETDRKQKPWMLESSSTKHLLQLPVWRNINKCSFPKAIIG